HSEQSLDPAKDLQCHSLASGKAYRRGAGEDGPYSMTAFLIGAHQHVLGRYRKRTLLPFGEYVPGESFFPAVRGWFTLKHLMEAGDDPGPLVTMPGHRLGVLICYEDMLPNNARQPVAAGADALFSLSQGTAF